MQFLNVWRPDEFVALMDALQRPTSAPAPATRQSVIPRPQPIVMGTRRFVRALVRAG